MNRTTCCCLLAAVTTMSSNLRNAEADTMLPIGVHIATDGSPIGSTGGEQPQLIGPVVTAGVVPIDNWNDFVITRFTNGQDKSNTNLPVPQSIFTTPTPDTLNDSSGTPTSAEVTAWTGNNTYVVYGTVNSTNYPNAALVNGVLGAINSETYPNYPAMFTISGVPYSTGYDVYVYFNNNTADQDAQIGLSSGTYNSSNYYVTTEGKTPMTSSPFFTDGSASTTPGNYNSSDYVEIPVPAPGTDGAMSQFTVTLTAAPSDLHGAPYETPGIAAIELVPVGYAVPEPSSLALFGLGVALAIGWRTRRCRFAQYLPG
jgi:hypothetical protein